MIYRFVVTALAGVVSLFGTGCSADTPVAPPGMSVSGRQPLPSVGTDLTEEFAEYAKTKNGNVSNLLRVEVVANSNGNGEPVMRVTIVKIIETAEGHWWLNEAALWMARKDYSGLVQVYNGEGQRLAWRGSAAGSSPHRATEVGRIGDASLTVR